MIAVLRRGMRLALPSGRHIVLVRLSGGEWQCRYAQAVRGEVTFTAEFLRRTCRVIA